MKGASTWKNATSPSSFGSTTDSCAPRPSMCSRSWNGTYQMRRDDVVGGTVVPRLPKANLPGCAPRPIFVWMECPRCLRQLEVLEGAAASCSKSPSGADHPPTAMRRVP